VSRRTAGLERSERNGSSVSLARLERFVRAIETRLKPEANFDAIIAHEKAISPSLDDRPRQLALF